MEISAFWQDTRVARMTPQIGRCCRPARGARWGRGGRRHGVHEFRRKIDETPGDHMNDALLFLKQALDGNHAGAEHDAPIFLEYLWPNDDVGDSAFILQRHEDDAAGGSRALPHQNKTGDLHFAPGGMIAQPCSAQHTAAGQVVANERNRVCLER